MKAEEVRKLQQQTPFHPFKVHMSDGREFFIEQRDQVLVTEYKLVIGIRGTGRGGFLESTENCYLDQIASIEESNLVPE
jgi:hypothetical protein